MNLPPAQPFFWWQVFMVSFLAWLAIMGKDRDGD